MKNIYNAYIKNWWIKFNDNNELILRLEICSTEGDAILNIFPNEIEKLFKILKISNIENLKNAPCIALITNYCMRTIGDFMFVSFEDIYSDKEELKERESKYWLDYDIYLKYKDE